MDYTDRYSESVLDNPPIHRWPRPTTFFYWNGELITCKVIRFPFAREEYHATEGDVGMEQSRKISVKTIFAIPKKGESTKMFIIEMRFQRTT